MTTTKANFEPRVQPIFEDRFYYLYNKNVVRFRLHKKSSSLSKKLFHIKTKYA